MIEYEIISEFICCGKYMRIVRFANATLIMPDEEWQWMYGQMHPELWKEGKRVVRRHRTVA